ncbi:DUF5658 family protein [Halobacteriaceae archaeon SHR40]|uniref:DUF5658 family protein n=1 Tax=Halovenus amylolytica TaxID=2500550 RepID=UPI000FE3B095
MWPTDLLRTLVGTDTRRSARWLTAQVFASIRSAERELWAVAITAMVLDVQLTIQGLQLGLTEMNPVARQTIDQIGFVGLYILKGCVVALAVVLRPLVPDQYGGVVPLALAIPSVFAVGINSTLLAWVVL